MQIWIYRREPEVLDYVYADGSYSDILNKAKTVIGRCFYIEPYEKKLRLCTALIDLGSYPWGLAKGSWSGGITLQDDPSFDVFNVEGLFDYPWNNTGVTGNAITEASYRDETETGDPDGFKIFPSTTPASTLGLTECNIDFGQYKKGSMLPYGLVNTLNILSHRNKILIGVNPMLEIPAHSDSKTEMQSLQELLTAITASNNNEIKYQQYYYPAASLCYAYEPSVKEGEKLSEKFKAHNWWLPSFGELLRFWWVCHELVTIGLSWSSNELTEGYIVRLNGSNTIAAYGSPRSDRCRSFPICAF